MKTEHVPLVVGNWKMNPQTPEMATRLATSLKHGLARVRGVEVVLAPPALYLWVVKKIQNGERPYVLGAQDAHWEKLGAHTGEISVSMLKSFGVRYIIVGHSERRASGEKDDAVHNKLHATLAADLTPILCVGERTRDEFGHYLAHVETQIRSACAGVSRSKLDRLVIAYEPVWAIGTGNTATPEHVQEMSLFVRKVLSDLYSRPYAEKARVLYGGSVTAANAGVLARDAAIDGFLVGGASLSAEEFCGIVTSVHAARVRV